VYLLGHKGMFQKYFQFVGAWIWSAYHNNFDHGSTSFFLGRSPRVLAWQLFPWCSGKRSDSLTILFSGLFATWPSVSFEPHVSAQSPKQKDVVFRECGWFSGRPEHD